jgi:hypothetical protein
MDGIGWILLAAAALGVAAGVALAVRLYLANPARVAGLAAAVAAIAVKTAMAYLPQLLGYLAKRMPPEEEAEWRAAERAGRGGEWLRDRWRKRRRNSP